MNEVLSARDEVLLAALRLTEDGRIEFSEWDLTVECWKINNNRWGLPGYREIFPDHKRVMNEIMSRKDNGVMTQGLLLRIGPNMYSLTTSGRVRAEAITSGSESKSRADYRLYDALKKYLNQSAFQQFMTDHSKPSTWLYVASFYDLSSSITTQNAKAHIRDFERLVKEAEKTMVNMGGESIRRKERGAAISKNDLNNLKEFHKTMLERFSAQFKALLEEEV